MRPASVRSGAVRTRPTLRRLLLPLLPLPLLLSSMLILWHFGVRGVQADVQSGDPGVDRPYGVRRAAAASRCTFR